MYVNGPYDKLALKLTLSRGPYHKLDKTINHEPDSSNIEKKNQPYNLNVQLTDHRREETDLLLILNGTVDNHVFFQSTLNVLFSKSKIRRLLCLRA